jgi:hypothetical protein
MKLLTNQQKISRNREEGPSCKNYPCSDLSFSINFRTTHSQDHNVLKFTLLKHQALSFLIQED